MTNTYNADFPPSPQMEFCLPSSVWQVAVICFSPVRAIKLKFSQNLKYTKELKTLQAQTKNPTVSVANESIPKMINYQNFTHFYLIENAVRSMML